MRPGFPAPTTLPVSHPTLPYRSFLQLDVRHNEKMKLRKTKRTQTDLIIISFFAAARSFAASLLSLPLTGTANVDGELPPLSDMLADSASLPRLASHLV